MKLLVRKDNNRIDGFCEIGSIEETEFHYIIEKDVDDISKILLSSYENGSIVYHPEWLEEEQKQEQLYELKQEQEAIFSQIQRKAALRSLPDRQAYSVRLLYDEWNQNGIVYELNDKVIHLDRFYKCLKDHTSSETLAPTLANYLWVEISDPSEEWPEWKKPLGYADAYSKGAKVTYKGEHYISKIDSNVYSPEEYPDGWDKVTS